MLNAFLSQKVNNTLQELKIENFKKETLDDKMLVDFNTLTNSSLTKKAIHFRGL